MSASMVSYSGPPSPACSSSHDRYSSPRSRRAPPDLADSGRRRVRRGSTPCPVKGSSATAAGTWTATSSGRPGAWPPEGAESGSPYSSTTRWALVPEMPKEFTPATRGHPRRGQSIISDVIRTGSRSQSTLGSGSWKWRCFGITPLFRTSAALISPATPAADSRWPMLVFTEPTSSGWSGLRPLP